MVTKEENKIKDFQGTNQVFLKVCQMAGVKPAKSQFNKWLRREGAARAKREEAKSEVYRID